MMTLSLRHRQPLGPSMIQPQVNPFQPLRTLGAPQLARGVLRAGLSPHLPPTHSPPDQT